MAVIYVDEIRDYGHKGRWCHMWTPDGSDADLDTFAKRLGLKQAWAHLSHGKIGRFYHYDLRPTKRNQAIAAGAVEIKLVDYIVKA